MPKRARTERGSLASFFPTRFGPRRRTERRGIGRFFRSGPRVRYQKARRHARFNVRKNSRAVRMSAKRMSARMRTRTTFNPPARGLSGMPIRNTVTLRQRWFERLEPATLRQWQLNSCLKPDFTDGGSTHSVMAFDNCAALYNNYTVIGCKWTLRITNLQSFVAKEKDIQTDNTVITHEPDGKQILGWVRVGTDSGTFITSFQEAVEARSARTFKLAPFNATSGRSTVVLSGYADMKKHVIRDVVNYQAMHTVAVTASPTNPVLLSLNLDEAEFDETTTNAIAIGDVGVEILLEYDVMYHEVKDVVLES